jgi:hypothetical protein
MEGEVQNAGEPPLLFAQAAVRLFLVIVRLLSNHQ